MFFSETIENCIKDEIARYFRNEACNRDDISVPNDELLILFDKFSKELTDEVVVKIKQKIDVIKESNLWYVEDVKIENWDPSKRKQRVQPKYYMIISNGIGIKKLRVDHDFWLHEYKIEREPLSYFTAHEVEDEHA
jgi:hypothetical protein